MLKNRCYNCHRVFFDVFQRFILTSFVLITKEPFKSTEQDFFTEQTLLNLLMSTSSVKGLKAIYYDFMWLLVTWTCLFTSKKGKGSLYLLPNVGFRSWSRFLSHKPNGYAAITFRQACSYPCNSYEGCYQFCCSVNRGTMGVNSLPKTVTWQCCGCDLNPGPSALESSTRHSATKLLVNLQKNEMKPNNHSNRCYGVSC